ncbi:MAG: hypothetical protein P8Z30_16435 [Acidobacteriota bacterium]
MLSLTVGSDTFKREFLNGHGNLNLDVSGGLNPAEPFPDSITTVSTGSATASTGDLTFGNSTGISMTASLSAAGSASIDLLRPQGQSNFAEKYGLMIPDGRIGAHFHLEGQAGGTLSGEVPLPAGMANFDFGIKAGANVFYDRFCLYNAMQTSGDMLENLVAELELPQHAGTPASLPVPGELLVFGYSGYLDLKAGLSWGYQLTGHEGADFKDLKAAIEYDLRLKASLDFGYKLAGDFEISARLGSNPGWVALAVKKSRTSKFSFAEAFQATANIKPTGLPSSADEFLSAFLGADVKHALDLFQKIRGYTDLDKLQADIDKILLNSVMNLANKWLGKALDQNNISEFVGMVGKIVDEYNAIDSRIVSAVTHLYEDYLDQNALQTLQGALSKIARLARRDDLASLSDAEAWKIINRLVGGDLATLLQDNTTFSEVTTIAQKGLDFLNGTWQPQLRDLVDELKNAFHLDQIFGELTKYDSKDKLKNLADTKLQGVVEKLLAESWDQIKSRGLGKSVKDLQKALNMVNDFKDNWYEKVVLALNQSFSLSVNYAYTQARENDALIDVEIDVSTPEGQALFNNAAHGRFKAILDPSNLSLIRVNKGVLTHQLTKGSQLQINVFGWEYRRLVDVIARTTNSVEVQATGLINVFTTEASIKQRVEKKGYSLESNFLMRLVGEASRPTGTAGEEDLKSYLVKTVNKLAVSYKLAISDRVTDVKELRQYLELAEQLRLIPKADAMAASLASQFPQGLGAVTATYVVNYDGDSIMDAFKNESGDPLKQIVRDTSRKLLSAHLINSNNPYGDEVVIGFAYRDGLDSDIFYRGGSTAFLGSNTRAHIPDWFPGGPVDVDMLARSSRRKVLGTFYNIEQSTANRLAGLDAAIDAARSQRVPVDESKLEEAAEKFVEKADILNQFGTENTFFGVFDAFIEIGSSGKAHRESTLILQITPKGAREAITKYLTA